LIIATGFFGKPKIPNIFNGLSVPVWHSSKVRDLYDLLTDNGSKPPAHGKNIVVIGGQMSGIETAGSLAFQISSAVNTPGVPPFPDAEKYVVTSVLQKPVWPLPLFLPKDPEVEPSGGEVTMKVQFPFYAMEICTEPLVEKEPISFIPPSGPRQLQSLMATSWSDSKHIRPRDPRRCPDGSRLHGNIHRN
jgi:hypothetical protein